MGKIRLSGVRIFASLAALATMISAASGQQTPTPKKGGTAVVAIGGDPTGINPSITTATPDILASCLVYEGLVIFNVKTEKFEPLLAKSWSISPDGKKYTFKLRKTTWHDGTPLTSEDVRYTVMEVASKFGPTFAAQAGKIIEAVDTPDPQTAEIRLKDPFGPLLLTLTCGFGFAVLPSHLFKGTEVRTNPVTQKPVGTGPFKLSEWVRADHLTFVRNDNYWDQPKPYLDKVVVRIIPNAATRSQALIAGEVDYISSNFFPQSDGKMMQAQPNVVFEPSAVPPNNYFAFFNLKKKPLDDVRVRNALLIATDRTYMFNNVFFGLGQVARAPWTKQIAWAADPSVDYDKSHPFDPEKAGQMLEAAGYKADASGIRFKLAVTYDAANSERGVATAALKAMWRRAGVDVTSEALEGSVLMPRVHKDVNFDVYISNYSSYSDPAVGIGRSFTSDTVGTSFGNASGYSNPEVDTLFDKASRLTNIEDRGAAYRQIQQILMRDIPLINLVDGQGFHVHNKKLVGAWDWAIHGRLGIAWFEP